MDSVISFDQQLFLALNGAWTPFLDPVMKMLSSVAVWFPLYLALAVFCFYRNFYHQERAFVSQNRIAPGRFWMAGVAAVAVCVLGYLICDWGDNLVKVLVARPRPGYTPETSMGRFPTGTGSPYGFFSAHAANTFCFAVLMSNILGHKWLKWCLLVWAALVSYSRIYLGYHFPLDVITGIIVGVCVGILLTCLYNFAVRKIAEKYPQVS